MGNRLSKIYTRTGDQGDTGLGDGNRIAKTHQRVEAMGSIDELNSAIGTISAFLPAKSNSSVNGLKACLLEIQHELFDLGGELCIPGRSVITETQITGLETTLDQYNENLPYLKEFILPGGEPAAAFTHLARSICRRAERTCLRLHQDEPINQYSLAYLNRLSDLLFVIARVISRSEGGEEIFWNKNRHS